MSDEALKEILGNILYIAYRPISDILLPDAKLKEINGKVAEIVLIVTKKR